MENDFNVEVENAIRIRRERVLAEHEESLAKAKERIARIEERLGSRLEFAERWAKRDVERLQFSMRSDAPPYLIKHWLILDSWNPDEAMLLLAGLEPAPQELKESRAQRTMLRRGRQEPELVGLRTLSGLRLWEDHSDIFPSWSKRVSATLFDASGLFQEASRIWASGTHPDRPTPAYVLEWARRKGIEVPWLAWAVEVGLWPAPDESATVSASEKGTLQKQIAGLALVLAEKSGRYKKGDKPNASQIAEAVGAILETLPDLNTNGLGASSIRANIKAGLDLLMK